MDVLLVERMNKANQYVEELFKAYQKEGHNVILDVQNFLYSKIIPDIVHIQWPEAIYRWRHKLPQTEEYERVIENRLKFYKVNGTKIVYTAHNLLPHSNVSQFDRNIYNIIMSFSDLIVHHGTKSISLIKKDFPGDKDSKHIVCPHGPYPVKKIDSAQARKNYYLPDDKYIYLNFGRQRENKGYRFIKDSFDKFNDKKSFLFTIGSKSEKYNSLITKTWGRTKKKVKLYFAENYSKFYRNQKEIFRYVPHKEIPKIIAATDAFFLGHQEGLNSGIVSLAASYGKPVVFPDLGNFKEQIDSWTWKENYKPGDINSAVKALNNMKKRIEKYSPGDVKFCNKVWLEKNSWSIHIQNIEKALQTIE